ncbi:SLAM family member 9-like [Aulostomus maculatus]
MCWSVVVLFLLWTSASSGTTLYKEVGSSVVLSPGSVVHPITRIVWRKGGDLCMEWIHGQIFPYREFQARGMLNTSSGELNITGLTQDDGGVYVVEIDDQTSGDIQLLVYFPVVTPTLSVHCDLTHCNFTCHSNMSGAEPVTYSWKSEEKVWRFTKVLKISKVESQRWFTCTLSNPVSVKSSEPIANPFTSRHRILTCVSLFLTNVLLWIIGLRLFVRNLWYSEYRHTDLSKKGQAAKII